MSMAGLSLAVCYLFQGIVQTISDVINQFACATMKGLPEHLLHLIVLCIKQLCFVQTIQNFTPILFNSWTSMLSHHESSSIILCI